MGERWIGINSRTSITKNIFSYERLKFQMIKYWTGTPEQVLQLINLNVSLKIWNLANSLVLIYINKTRLTPDYFNF